MRDVVKRYIYIYIDVMCGRWSCWQACSGEVISGCGAQCVLV